MFLVDYYSATLLGLCVVKGDDGTSVFKGKGNVGRLNKLDKYPRFHKEFMQLVGNMNVKPHALKQLEQFTCLTNGQNREFSVELSGPNSCA